MTDAEFLTEAKKRTSTSTHYPAKKSPKPSIIFKIEPTIAVKLRQILLPR
jgi:hypothetical protein